MLVINLSHDVLEAEMALKGLKLQLNPSGRKRLCGKLATSLKRTFRRKFNENGAAPKEGERGGWTSTGFWQKAGDSIETDTTPGGVSLRVPQKGVGLQYRGGTVKPTDSKNLAIPLVKSVYGQRPLGFPLNEFFVYTAKTGKKNTFLARAKSQPLELCYLLKPSVTINPHPEKFPTDEQIITDAEQVVRNHIAIEKLKK